MDSARKYLQYFEYKNVLHTKVVESDGTRRWVTSTEPPMILASVDEPTKFKSIRNEYLKPLDFKDIASLRSFFFDFPETLETLYGSKRIGPAKIAETSFEPATGADYVNALFDIETEVGDGFPEPFLAEQAVNMITIKRSNTDIIDSMTTCDVDIDIVSKESGISADKINLIIFDTEDDLLRGFVRYFNTHDIDVYGGWNSTRFDVQYLGNRITKRLGPSLFASMSPVSQMKVESRIDKYGEEYNEFTHYGLQHLDYQQVYTKYMMGSRESMSLDYISKYELDVGKLEHHSGIPGHLLYKHGYASEGLAYNIVDVIRLEQILQKTGQFNLVATLAQLCRVNLTDTEFVTRLILGYTHKFLFDQGEFMPLKMPNVMDRHIVGGYVKVPVVGKHKYVFSADLASSYPSGMRAINISPEMKGPKLGNGITSDIILAGDGPAIPEGMTMAANGQCFSRSRRGMFPRMLDSLYARRKQAKAKKLEYEKLFQQSKNPEHENEAKRWKNEDLAVKLVLNSVYGAMASKTYLFYDPDVAEAVTETGQLAVKQLGKSVMVFLNNPENQKRLVHRYCSIHKLEVPKIAPTQAVYIYADTDSGYFSLAPLIEQLPWDEPTRLKFLEWVADGPVQEAIRNGMKRVEAMTAALVTELLNADRETISPAGIFLSKKKYGMLVSDMEGVKHDPYYLKVQGISIVQSATPGKSREALKKFLRRLILDPPEDSATFVQEFSAEFFKMKPDDIGKNIAVSDIDKYRVDHKSWNYGKGTPAHVRAAINHNKVIVETNQQSNIEFIKAGDKLRFVYLKKPNPINDNVIGWKGEWPDAFTKLRLDKCIDTNVQFDKVFKSQSDALFKSIGHNPAAKIQLDIF